MLAKQGEHIVFVNVNDEKMQPDRCLGLRGVRAMTAVFLGATLNLAIHLIDVASFN
jgi:hypothetical protein